MLRCAASLWSADLAHLADEIRRVEPYADRFHIDVADGQYVDASAVLSRPGEGYAAAYATAVRGAPDHP